VTTPAPRPRVNDQHLTTAEDLLDALRSKTWGEPRDWIYRGQSNADWSLRPTAFRSPAAFRPFGIDGDTSNWSPREFLLMRGLTRFRDGLDASGVAIPVQAPSVDIGERDRTTFGAMLPEAYPLMALAQHHGLPTLLLDWTRRGPIAAYFAASSALDPTTTDKGSHLAVWALRAQTGELIGYGRNDDQTMGIVRVYQAPAGTNPNMRAQAGLFTFVFGYDDPGVETIVARRADDGPELRRLTLPHAEAPKLLRLLASEGITGASMFPGADGVVRSMREESLWDRPVFPAPKGNPWSQGGGA